MPRMASIAKRWKQVPPLNVSVFRLSMMLGYEPQKEIVATEKQQDPAQLLGDLGGMGFSSGKPEWLKKMST